MGLYLHVVKESWYPSVVRIHVYFAECLKHMLTVDYSALYTYMFGVPLF